MISELLKVLSSPLDFLWVVVVFGFAPGFCLRLIVRAYPRNDPRRSELIAELYAVPRIKRPLWVAEQLEVALFEGLGHRVSAVVRTLSTSWRLAVRAVWGHWVTIDGRSVYIQGRFRKPKSSQLRRPTSHRLGRRRPTR